MKRFILDYLSVKCLTILIVLFLGSMGVQAQNCNPDTQPPVAVCDEFTVVSIGLDDLNDCYGPAGFNNQPPAFGPNLGAGVAIINAATFDDGSYDECTTNLKFTVQRVAPYSSVINNLNQTNGQAPCNDAFPDFPSEFERAIAEQETIKFYAGEFNSSQVVALRVYQLNPDGSVALHNGQPLVSTCLINVEVQDKTKPVCVAPANVTITCEAYDPTFGNLEQPTVTDNACLDTVITTVNNSQFNEFCNQGTIVRTFKAYDCSGNSSQCTQTIQVDYNQHYFVKFPNDMIVPEESPTGEYGTPTFFGEDCELMATSYTDQVFTTDPFAEFRIERVWSVINWCTYNPNLPGITVPNPNPNADATHPANLPGPIVSEAGTLAPWAPTVVKINATDPAPTDYSTFWQQNANLYTYQQTIWIVDTFFVGVNGKVFSDTSASCAYETGESLLEGWTVKLTGLTTGQEKTIQTNANGEYTAVMNGMDTQVSVTLVNAGNFGQGCATVYTVNGVLAEFVTQDIPVHLEERCELLTVGIAAPLLRRCFNNRYQVQACNLSSETINNAYVEIDLDAYLSYVGSSIPGTVVSGNLYRFEVGNMIPGDCAAFWVDVYTSCEAPLGATHCTEARVYPYDDCRSNTNWSGADVDVTAACDGDSVRLKITNIGDGSMSQQLDFVVVEDIIMFQSNTFNLGVGESLELAFPANGSTWRLEAEEEPFHPFGGLQAAALEGCGGMNQPGLVNLFPLSDPNPFVALDCQQNIGSFDPNDKQAFPKGLGDEHQLLPNTDIEYLIRFQNTGTDTAFNVVVLDTLSTFLNPATVRVGAASHPMEFGVLEGGILRFSFPNIMLPDSNINEPASHGFLKFRVSQMPDNAEGTVINNSAAIYFDFNEPVITNTTFHTIREHLMLVSTNNLKDEPVVKVSPNPSSTAADFQFDQNLNAARFELQNRLGQVVRSEEFTGTQFRFERGNLVSGIYFFNITTQNGPRYAGKIVID